MGNFTHNLLAIRKIVIMTVTLHCLRIPLLILLVIVATLAAACGGEAGRPEAGRQEAGRPDAAAALRLADGTQIGTVQFSAGPNGTVGRVELTIPEDRTAVRAFHGFHIHANDDPANGEGCIADPNAAPATWFVSADGHLKAPTEQHPAHRGDMPPLLVNSDGTASATFMVDRFTPQDLIGRTVILHSDPDNLGNVPVGAAADQYTPNSQAALDDTAATGNAGDRIACGVIGA
jgi:superoxide dismutase, Cu-Zn family